jgi:hypothetical protein
MRIIASSFICLNREETTKKMHYSICSLYLDDTIWKNSCPIIWHTRPSPHLIITWILVLHFPFWIFLFARTDILRHKGNYRMDLILVAMKGNQNSLMAIVFVSSTWLGSGVASAAASSGAAHWSHCLCVNLFSQISWKLPCVLFLLDIGVRLGARSRGLLSDFGFV